MTRLVLALALVLVPAVPMLAQAKPTAIRRADLQAGVAYVSGNSDFSSVRYNGYGFYTDLDLTNRYGAEFNLHQINSPQGDQVFERTFEFGFRYHRTYGRFVPYARAMYGRGVFNYPHHVANLAYNIFVFGGGVDFKAKDRIYVRVDYEYEMWRQFTPHSLSPQLLTFGVAYHFPGALNSHR